MVRGRRRILGLFLVRRHFDRLVPHGQDEFRQFGLGRAVAGGGR